MHRIVFFTILPLDDVGLTSRSRARACFYPASVACEENNARRLVRSGWVERTSTTTAAALPTAVGWSEEFRIFSTKKPVRAEKPAFSTV
jgi:hypothetical protein